MVDLVNHPPHYQAGGIESIDVIEGYRLGFSLGNAVKYLLRAGRKTFDPTSNRTPVFSGTGGAPMARA